MLKSTPLLRDLCHVVTPYYGAKWKTIGILLGFHSGELDIIENDHRNAEPCCNEMWSRWLSKDDNATWKTVIDILEFKTVLERRISLSNIPQSNSEFVNFCCIIYAHISNANIKYNVIVITRRTKKFEFKKGVGIDLCNKSKEQVYGTSHPHLKRSSRVTCACKAHSLHALLLHACIFMCFLVLHQKYVRKHMHLHWITTHKTAHTCAWSMAKIFL